MDFFEAQERAKKRTTRLVALFVLAVLGLIAAGYGAVVASLHGVAFQTSSGLHVRDSYWQPDVLAGVSFVTLAIVGLSSLFKWLSFRTGGRAVAEMVGARAVNPSTTDLRERQLLNVVEEMSIASGVPVPPVYVMDGENGINAFAAGLTTSDAVVAVTRGTLEKLNRDELQGVVAHEFSHILNGDMRLNVKLTAIVFGILVLGLIGRGIVYSLRFSRPRRGSGKGGGGVMAIIALGVVLMIIGYIGYFFGRLIQAAVSRQREYLADAAAVQFTRNPAGISGALRKIGGYALGSNLQSAQSAQVGHFLFAQGFRSNFGGLWATHPPLPVRIRAIDPSFDGKFYEPATVVDVAREPWSRVTGRPATYAKAASPGGQPPPLPAAIIGSIGTLTALAVATAQDLLESIPARLHEAAHSAAEAPALIYGLLLDRDPKIRAAQLDHVARLDGEAARRILDGLIPDLDRLGNEHRLPLVQLTLGVLRSLPPAVLSNVLGTLDELVHADRQVSTFEFALQKVLVHHLELAGRPTAAPGQHIQSFNAVADEISLVLSALARVAGDNPERDFTAGAAQLRLLNGKLKFLPPSECGVEELDAALTRLAAASNPIKQRLLTACAAIATADGTFHVAEAELLRAFASALDCPLPPLSTT